MADVDLLLFEIASALKSTVDSKFPEFDHLKLEQVLSIVQFVMRKDVFAVLPTGFGKSVIFQVIPRVCSMLAARGLDYPEKPIIVVICPLVTTSANPSKLIRRYNLHRSFRTFSFTLSSILHCFTGLHVSAVIRET